MPPDNNKNGNTVPSIQASFQFHRISVCYIYDSIYMHRIINHDQPRFPLHSL